MDGLLNRVQSHAFHAFLIAKDLLREDKAGAVGIKCLQCLEHVSSALAKIGGAPTHPPNIVVGGVLRAPTETAISEALKSVAEARKLIEDVVHAFKDEDSYTEVAKVLSEVKLGFRQLATHLYHRDRFNIRVGDVKVVYPASAAEGCCGS